MTKFTMWKKKTTKKKKKKKTKKTITSKPHAHPHTMKKLHAKFYNFQYKPVRGGAHKR